MPDPRFFEALGAISIVDALRETGAAAVGPVNASAVVSRIAAIDDDDLAGALVHVDDHRRLSALHGKPFALCLAPKGAAEAVAALKLGTVASINQPKAAFAALAAKLYRQRRLLDAGSAAARIDTGARVHASAVIAAGAHIGAGAEIGPFVVIGPGVVIGEATVVAERASIWCAMIGKDCRIGAGSVIGGPGFGFAPSPEGLTRAPQLGRVLIEDRVELGAGVCVDRGALGDTVIGAMTKIDNLCQIAHNVRIGRACLIAAQVGVAGSSTLGDRVQCGGQAGIADHLTIGEDARIAAKAGVMRDVPKGETWGGYPARPMMTWMRETAVAARAARGVKKADRE